MLSEPFGSCLQEGGLRNFPRKLLEGTPVIQEQLGQVCLSAET